MTPHNEAKKEEIAKKVIMPGDPLRAKMIAETYLENAVLVNRVRGMYAFTGTYKGERITVMASGMGNPSMGVYAYELFKVYDVDQIIRIGTAGSYTKDIKLYDMILATSSVSNSNFAFLQDGTTSRELLPDEGLNQQIREAAKRMNIPLIEGRAYCTDLFYDHVDPKVMYEKYHLLCAEMESFALFQNAKYLKKKAACILSVSNNIETKEETTVEERQNALHKMIQLALESCL